MSSRGISTKSDPVCSSQYSGKSPSILRIPPVRSSIDGMGAGRCGCCP